eukprot:CAMPEP_0119479782 /NCGR_PEP_ID=MMETSP1344-20130328/8894_1 /TAXON_ID=236787 /ORGANISM="Florenciella parvula, Strain CCMP2471" /LENGTH=84 /DNA_ID=CAMNT_0007514043 /DNA_START=565 /DNA_END=819 /DNA_ORIENTATION=+
MCPSALSPFARHASIFLNPSNTLPPLLNIAARAAIFSSGSEIAKVLAMAERASSNESMYSSIWKAAHGSSGYSMAPSTMVVLLR